MKRYVLPLAALLVSTAAYAETPAPADGGPGPRGPGRMMMMGGDFKPATTRQEAIDNAKAHVSRLEKMSDEEWNKMRGEHKSRMEKWKNATPEEREKMRKVMMEKKGDATSEKK